MKYILNIENMNYLKENLNVDYIESLTNKNIINDIFDDDVEFIVDDEIFVDVAVDEFIDNIIILCIIQYFKGSINNESIENLNYYVYDKLTIYHNYHNYINQIQLKEKYYNSFNRKFYYNSYNYNLMNFIYIICCRCNLFLNESYKLIHNKYDDDVDIKNRFIFNVFSINQIFKHDNYDDYIENYNELIECIYIYDDKYDLIDEIDEIFEIDNKLSFYVDYEKIIDDLIDDHYYYVFENVYIKQYYF